MKNRCGLQNLPDIGAGVTVAAWARQMGMDAADSLQIEPFCGSASAQTKSRRAVGTPFLLPGASGSNPYK
jgi:hypothetical protein